MVNINSNSKSDSGSRKGMSAAEKATRLLAFFHDSLSFFAIKDIERQGAKATGINSMQIKDILQGLIDDGLVRCEKIGSGNYYWSFPSDASRSRILKLESMRNKVEAGNENVALLEEKLQLESAAREKTEEREVLLKDVDAKQSNLSALNAAISKYSDCDPELLEIQQHALAKAKEAVNRWTDNIFSVIGYFREQGTDVQMVYKEFGIPDDLDSVS
ncbi:meiotic nuclear division protein 1 [Lipomyces chichibuensis]|uniref:meiotic nuclear division protein 1 n=1 Tax=Lipomyces chichibuensis TaxID=1546026 RepID=UPI003343E8A1